MNRSSETNWLIVGLGNPGARYEKTRHNLGFMLVDWLAREFQTQVKREECRSLIGRAEIENQKVELVKPQTFMNLSGEAIGCLLKKETRSREKLIVISDDLALPLGTLRLRAKGSAGGHNGLKSIIGCLRTEEFIRLRIGIQPEHPLRDTKDFVLENFSKMHFETVEKVLEQSAEAIRAVLSDGIEKAMAQFN
ncbi:MAG: Peptidyl-tRNA hydrolase [uncultured Pyrinomonadaceae bacterium]|uniref:Peptidyl-tRNA hydrolase n=1 Tax=uncultured Pyrinomonadaceae bacterium TaxID=2283094 RepID=A0A6J4NA93_9BACT|nr:MAG: Peptidyl-tRNA hydrolase [uncultured Pyrinomonadaceae bacterium]